MYDIFEKLCEEKNVTPYRVSKETGVTTATLTSWKQGKYTPKDEKLRKIAEYFKVSVEYIKTGKEPELGEFSSQADLLIRVRNDKDLMQSLEKYFELSDKKKKHVVETINLLSE